MRIQLPKDTVVVIARADFVHEETYLDILKLLGISEVPDMYAYLTFTVRKEVVLTTSE